MSLAITDLMEAEFTDLRNDNGESLLKPDIQFSDWIKQTYLSSGSLLARSCRSAVELADHREDQKEAAASFGENMAYLQQVRKKILKEQFQSLEPCLTKAYCLLRLRWSLYTDTVDS